MKLAANDPVALVVEVPLGVPTEASPGDNGFGYTISFVENPNLIAHADYVAIIVNLRAPVADGWESLPVKVDFVPTGNGPLIGGSGSGSADAWVRVLAISEVKSTGKTSRR